MATKYQPKRQTLPDASGIWQWFQNQLGLSYTERRAIPGTVEIGLQPQGYYSGAALFKLDPNNTIITNPWGTTATTQRGYTGPPITLEAGQSIDMRTGRLSDPNLHAGTAKRLNEAVQKRQVNESGVNTAGRGTSVLASLDDLYFANQATSVPTSEALTAQAQAKQGGLDSMARKTLLGVQKPLTPTPAPNPFRRG